MILRFGDYELDTEAEQLMKAGRVVRLQPKPFRLLYLLANQSGRLVTREEIRATLWTGDTFVDFEQGVNFAVKQVRNALGEDADHPVYLQTVPKRGYRFLAPVSTAKPGGPHQKGTDGALAKVLWTNIAELRLADSRDRERRKTLLRILSISAVLAGAVALAWLFFHFR